MEGLTDKLEIFKILRKIRKIQNFDLALMSREEKIDYIVSEMNWIEENIPEVVEYIEDEFDDDYDKGFDR